MNTLFQLLILGFVVGLALFFFNIIASAVIWSFVALYAGCRWVVQKMRGVPF